MLFRTKQMVRLADTGINIDTLVEALLKAGNSGGVHGEAIPNGSIVGYSFSVIHGLDTLYPEVVLFDTNGNVYASANYSIIIVDPNTITVTVAETIDYYIKVRK